MDYTDLIRQTRLNLGDTSVPNVFTDNQIIDFLEQSSLNAKAAAGLGYLAIAANTVLLLKYVRTDDLLVDGAKVAAELRQVGQTWLALGNAEIDAENDDYFNIVGMTTEGACGCGEYVECGHPHGYTWCN